MSTASGTPHTTNAMSRANAALERVLKKKAVVPEEKEDEIYATGVKKERIGLTEPSVEIDQVMHGVTVGWLAQAFNMNPTLVKEKLRDCPPIHRRKNGFIYQLKLACRYLVPPAFNIEEYLRNMRIDELPLRLQTEFWNAKNKRREYEENTGQLWRTEDVVMVLGEVFQTVKHAAMLLPGNLERTAGLSDHQSKIVTAAVDGLLDEIYTKLRKMKATPKTRTVLAHDLEAETAELKNLTKTGPSLEEYYAQEVAQDLSGEDEIPDDYSYLV